MKGHDPLWTTGEVAALFRVDPKTVRRWVERGELSQILTPSGQPRYRESEVKALLAARTDARPGIPTVTPPHAGPGPNPH